MDINELIEKMKGFTPKHSMSNVFADKFYQEELFILPAFRHVQTPAHIKKTLEAVRHGNFSKTDLWFKEEAINFMKSSLKNSGKTGRPGPDAFPENLNRFPSLYYLTEPMKNTYYQWRQQFLNNKNEGVRLYHLMLFVTELANYTFNPRAAFNLSMMYHLTQLFKDVEGIHETLFSVYQDMLMEAGEENDSQFVGELPVYLKMRGETELYYALKKYQKAPASNPLHKISINVWKRHFERPRKNQFFNTYRTKIYKTFKECLVVLDEAFKEQGSSLYEALFSQHQEQKELRLFDEILVYRADESSILVEQPVEVVGFSPEMDAILRNYYRMSENVTRSLHGEKRQLKLEAGVLPEDLFNKMLDQMTPKPKVKKKPVPEPEVHVPVEVSFDAGKITRLQQETDALVREVEERSLLAAEEKELPPLKPAIEPVASVSMSLEEFFSKGSGDGNETAFLEVLTPLEREFLSQFEGLVLAKKAAAGFLKEKGKMLGSTVGSLNEKALEHLEDVLIEENGENLEILEEYADLAAQF